MPSLTAELARPSAPRRLWALARITMPALRAGWLSRAGRAYAWSSALLYGAVGAYLSHGGDGPGALAALTLGLTWTSWAGGLVAYAAARDPEPGERALGLDVLTAARAVPRELREPARLIATMGVVTRPVLWPSLAAVALVLVASRGALGAGAGLLLVALVALYAVVFGVTFGALARWAALLSGRYARVVFALVVLAPALADDLLATTPSLPACFGWMIAWMSARVGDVGALT